MGRRYAQRMTPTKRENLRPVLRFTKSELVIGPKFWWGCVFVVALVVLGVLVTPQNGWAGAGIGVAGVLGALLGMMFQTTPRERDFTAEGAAAVRGLLTIVRDVENAQHLTTQLAKIEGVEERIKLGLVDVQNRLLYVRTTIYTSMSEWEQVAPGSLDEIERLREAGQSALQRLSEEAELG